MRPKFVTITVMSGAKDGRTFGLYNFPVILGRYPNDSVFLPHDRGVSRHHTRITCNNDSFFLEYLGVNGKGSTKGTYLNDHIVNTKTPISSGDMLLLGTVWLRFDKPNDITSNSPNNNSLGKINNNHGEYLA